MGLTVDQIMLRTSFRTETDAARLRRNGVSAYQNVKSVTPEPTTNSAASTQKRGGLSDIQDDVDFSPIAQMAAESDSKKVSADDARIEALSREKGRAREALERIKDEIKLMRKVWQYQPQEMAKQIARLAKELKEILTTYKKVQKELASLQGGNAAGGGLAMPAMGGMVAPAATGQAEGTSDQTDTDSAGEAETADGQASVADEAAEPAEAGDAAGDTSDESLEDTGDRQQQVIQYERVRLDQTPEAFELRGDLEFVRFVKGLKNELRDAFNDVKRWAIGFNQDDKASQKLYNETEKGLKKLEKDLGDFEDDLRRSMPPSIWVSQPVEA